MKKLITILFVVLITQISIYAQKSIWVVTEIKDTSISGVSLPSFDLKLFTLGNSSDESKSRIIPVRNDDVDFPNALIDEKLIFKFYGYNTTTGKLESKLKLSETGIKSISIIVDNEIIYTKDVKEYEKNYDSYNMGLSSLKDVKTGSVVQVRFNKENDDVYYYNGESAYFKHYKPITTYGTFNKIPVLWIPTAMFATSTKRTESGVTFAPMPIGLAAGFKLNNKKGNYWGFSACANWLIHQNEVDGEKNINLESIAPGIIIDWNNNLTFGFVYGLDLTTEKNNPGFSLMIGFAPDVLNLLKE